MATLGLVIREICIMKSNRTQDLLADAIVFVVESVVVLVCTEKCKNLVFRVLATDV